MAEAQAIDDKLAAMDKEHGIHSTVEDQVKMRDFYVDPADMKNILVIKVHDVVGTLKVMIVRIMEG